MPYKDPAQKLANAAKYRASNREKIAQSKHQSYVKHLERNKAKSRAYYAATKDRERAKRNAAGRKHHAANRARQNARHRAHYATNKTTILAKHAAYRVANKEHIHVQQAEYRAKNTEKIHQKNVAYYAETKEKFRERNRKLYAAYHAKNKAKRMAQNAAWYATHPDAVTIKRHRRRARILSAPVNDLTRSQWQAIKDHYGHCCVYCGRHMERLTMDHIIPLSKGGAHTIQNVVPACMTCNAKKQAGPPLTPVQPLLLCPTAS